MPPKAKEEVVPTAPTGADKPSEDAVDAAPKAAKKASKKVEAPKRTSVKTASGVEIGWTEG
jgi:hypothetical protein